MKKGLILAEESFMDNFLPEWKAQFEFDYYTEAMGERQYLSSVKQG